jgi:outer membrane protein OmpU
MKNIIKTMIVMLTSVSLFSSANAGDLNVSGSAKATYNIQSGASVLGKGLGVTNELNFTASGELDNGYTWNYSMELDPDAVASANGAAQNDDTKMTLTGPLGTFAVCVSECGLDVEDAASQSVYARPTDAGDVSSGSGDNYTIDAYNSVQYHTPADLLPFGLTAKGAFAPNLTTTHSSGNAKGAEATLGATTLGSSAYELQVKAAPIDGMSVGASFFSFEGAVAAGAEQTPQSGAWFASYALGPVTVGYSKAYKDMLIANGEEDTTGQVEHYLQTNYSIAFMANDNLSLSYEFEQDSANYSKAGSGDKDQESSAVQVAYTMGGMTVSLHHGNYDNIGWVTGQEVDQTLLAVAMAF